jgi:hypothetical protein
VDLNYQKVWSTMNDLETTMCRAVSVREVIDAAVVALERGDRQKAENLMNAAYDFIGYFVDDFDKHFKDAWAETVGKLNPYGKTSNVSQDEYKKSWTSFWEENYYPEEYKEPKLEDIMPPWGHSDMEALRYTEEELNAMCDKAASDDEKEKCREYNLREAEYYDKRAKLDMNSTYDDMIAAGYTMTADGFWIKEDKVVKWRLPVEIDAASGEYYFTVPDDLMERTGWEENDKLNWVDNGDGSFTITKHTKPLGMDEC